MSRAHDESREPTAARARECMPTRDEAQALIERVVKLSKADEISVNVGSGYQATCASPPTRCRPRAASRHDRRRAELRSARSTRSSTTNDLSDDVARARRRAVGALGEAGARRSGGDAARSAPQQYHAGAARTSTRRRTLDAGRARAARRSRRSSRRARRATSRRPASSSSSAGAAALGNKQGTVRVPPHRRTRTTRSPCARPTAPARLGGRRASTTGAKLDFASVSAARDRQGAAVAESGRDRAGPLHGDPRAAGGRRSRAAHRRLRSTRASADEGRSRSRSRAAATRSARRSWTSASRIISDPADPQLLGQPFDGDGLPLGRQVLDRERRAEELSYSRFWAQKQGKAADRRRRRSFKMIGGTHDRRRR